MSEKNVTVPADLWQRLVAFMEAFPAHAVGNVPAGKLTDLINEVRAVK